MRRLPLFVWLVVVWVALWGDLSAANVLSGVVAAAVVLALVPTSRQVGERPVRVRPLALVRFELHFLRKLIESTAIVAWEIVTPRNRIREGIVAVEIQGWSPFVTTLVANAVSLTPGTITLEVGDDGRVLYVHVLHLRDPDAVRREVQHLETLAIRALGGGPAQALETTKERGQ